MAELSSTDAENEMNIINDKNDTKIASLTRGGEGADVIIRCKDGVVNAHRVILSDVSPYFAAMNEDIAELTQFKDVPTRVIECVVDFIYGVEINKLNLQDDDFIKEVLLIVYLTQVEPLFEYCWNALVKKLRVENFVETWQMAHKLEEKDVNKKLTLFIINNFWEIIDTESILSFSSELMRNFIAVVGKYFSGDDLAYFVAKWVNVDTEKRQKEIDFLFLNIDISKLSSTCFQDFLNGNVASLSEEVKLRFTTQELFNLSPDKEKTMEIYFSYFLRKSVVAVRQVYNVDEKKWYVKKCCPMPPLMNWISILRKHGEQIFFAINAENQFVAYDYSKEKTIVGPTVNSTKIVGINDEKIIYVWDGASTLAKFNVEDSAWMRSIEIPEDLDFAYVFNTSSKLFALGKNNAIFEYNSENNQWLLKSKEEFVKPISFSNFKNDETQKIYFTNEKSDIVIYNAETDSWETKNILQADGRLPFYFVECENPFVLYSGKNRDESDYYEDNPWIYYLDSNRWEKLPTGMCKKLLTRIRMSRVSCFVDKN